MTSQTSPTPQGLIRDGERDAIFHNRPLFCTDDGCDNSMTENLAARYKVTTVLGCYGEDVTDPRSDTGLDDYPITAVCDRCGAPATQNRAGE